MNIKNHIPRQIYAIYLIVYINYHILLLFIKYSIIKMQKSINKYH